MEVGSVKKITLCGHLCNRISECRVKLHSKSKYRHYYAKNLVNGYICGLYKDTIKLLMDFQVSKHKKSNTWWYSLPFYGYGRCDFSHFSLSHAHSQLLANFLLLLSPIFIDQTCLPLPLSYLLLSSRLAFAIAEIISTSHFFAKSSSWFSFSLTLSFSLSPNHSPSPLCLSDFIFNHLHLKIFS